MWLTFAVLLGILINPAITASPLARTPANSGAQTAFEQGRKAVDKKLEEAVEAGDAEATRALLRSGADVNGVWGTPLSIAVRRNDLAIARILIEAGAKVDPEAPGSSPLIMAVEGDHEEMLRLLLAHGAKVNGDGPGSSPLYRALFFNRLDLARILIAAGADVNAEKAYAESHHRPEFVIVLQKALAPAPPPMTVEQVIQYLESQADSKELGGAPENSEPPTAADVTRTVSELRGQLKTKPQDTHALMLWARFAFIPYPDILVTGYVPSASEKDFLAPAVALDRVLAAEPHNAEALFLKGRITLGRNPEKGVALVRQALESAPDNLKYREFLAQYLANHGRMGEAGQVLRAAQKDPPMIPFLEDLEAVGVPEGGELLAASGLSLPMMLVLGDAGLADHMNVRLRTYRYRKSPAEIESFYAGHIPGFRFVPHKEEDEDTPAPEGPTLLLHAYQFLQVKSGSVKIMSGPIESLDLQKTKDGIEMQLFEIKNDPDLKRKLRPGEHSCYLILTNFRK